MSDQTKEYIVQAFDPDTIKAFEAHFAANLVRCKDCKHGGVVAEVGTLPYVRCNGVEHPLDWFCADGERWSRNNG